MKENKRNKFHFKTDRNDELKGKVALITGGSSGIGFATAYLFAQQGAKIAILARGETKLNQASDEIKATFGTGISFPIVCDVRDEKQVENAFARTLDVFGALDIVVSNAGYVRYAPFLDTSLDLWQDMMAIHSTAYFLVAREAVRCFKEQNAQGTIVFIISDNAIKPSKEMLAYNVAKASELHMARCIADECGYLGVRINSILPGAVFGGSAFWTDDYREARAKIHGFKAENLEEEYKKNSALNVVIEPEEVAEITLFLASERSKKITGAVMSIDGGGRTGYVR
jgi:NAD(P)-dependent dehydrogenase (short-subunit alcohol dehydrogenase family)